VLSIIQGDDDIRTLDVVKIYTFGKVPPRTVEWAVDPNKESRFYKDFSTYLPSAMKSKKLTRHFHTYSVTLKTYNETPGLKNEMLIT